MSAERDNKGRFEGCPLAWCHTHEQCGTVGACLCKKYKDEGGGGYATAGVQYSNDGKSAEPKPA